MNKTLPVYTSLQSTGRSDHSREASKAVDEE